MIKGIGPDHSTCTSQLGYSCVLLKTHNSRVYKESYAADVPVLNDSCFTYLFLQRNENIYFCLFVYNIMK